MVHLPGFGASGFDPLPIKASAMTSVSDGVHLCTIKELGFTSSERMNVRQYNQRGARHTVTRVFASEES